MSPFVSARALSVATALIAAMTAGYAQNYPVTSTQRAEAQQVAQKGVPVSELSPNAPDSYTVKRGDTLWGISGLFLRRPWRWPELWGMNMDAIRNPHLIYPGQVLYLHKENGYARLSTAASRGDGGGVVRLSPKTRNESLAAMALPTLPPNIIEAFLTEPLIVDQNTLAQAPRIMATMDQRVLMASGDRAYVRGGAQTPLIKVNGQSNQYRIFRDTVPLKDPATGEILGYEAKYLGNAELIVSETPGEPVADDKKEQTSGGIPATVMVSKAKNEIYAGDRLLPSPEREFLSYVPHAPVAPVNALVVSLYGDSAVTYAGQNQVISINKGKQDGMDVGTVLELISRGSKVRDKTSATREVVQLPDERNGYAMVFRSFDRVSYALIMQVNRGVVVGDKLASPSN